MWPIGRHRRVTLASVVLGAALSGCGSDFGLLVTVRCDAEAEPPCSLAIPADIDTLAVELTQPAQSPPPLTEVFVLKAGQAFPLSVSVSAGAGAEPGDVEAAAMVYAGGVSGTVVASGAGGGPLVRDQQTEIIIELAPMP